MTHRTMGLVRRSAEILLYLSSSCLEMIQRLPPMLQHGFPLTTTCLLTYFLMNNQNLVIVVRRLLRWSGWNQIHFRLRKSFFVYSTNVIQMQLLKNKIIITSNFKIQVWAIEPCYFSKAWSFWLRPWVPSSVVLIIFSGFKKRRSVLEDKLDDGLHGCCWNVWDLQKWPQSN